MSGDRWSVPGFSYDQFYTHNKSDTNDFLNSFPYSLSNGTPVNLGVTFGNGSPCCASDEEPSYEVVSAALGMPVGAIGPTRMRCLERLRRTADLAGLEG